MLFLLGRIHLTPTCMCVYIRSIVWSPIESRAYNNVGRFSSSKFLIILSRRKTSGSGRCRGFSSVHRDSLMQTERGEHSEDTIIAPRAYVCTLWSDATPVQYDGPREELRPETRTPHGSPYNKYNRTKSESSIRRGAVLQTIT